ncbi:hypothetical protein [Bdellovibrio sp. BCCA]|uniref:hypothetical protein n=1 Tax=Bdellovibrio sp. BCCA TaxID=3136281 RepID=UPI0030F33407
MDVKEEIESALYSKLFDPYIDGYDPLEYFKTYLQDAYVVLIDVRGLVDCGRNVRTELILKESMRLQKQIVFFDSLGSELTEEEYEDLPEIRNEIFRSLKPVIYRNINAAVTHIKIKR